MMLGSASGLDITPCNMEPDNARLIPTSPAKIIRGRRMFHIAFHSGDPSAWNSSSRTLRKGI